MIRKILTATLASAAIAIAAPALAGPGGGGHGGHGGNGGGLGAGASANAGMHGGGNGGLNANTNAGGMILNPAAGVSQGPAHASITGITNANSHSVLASGAVPGSTLSGLQTGLNVMNSSGMTIGTVSQIVTDSSGNIRLVIVTSSTGQTFRLAPNTLTINNGVVTTTSTIG